MASQNSARKVLRVSELSKSAAGALLIERLNMDLALGQAGCLVSDNRDRLSLLIELLSGAEKEDAGAIFLGEGAAAVGPLSPKQRLARGAAARERPALIDKLSVLDNIFLGAMENWTRFGILRFSRMRRRAAEALRSLDCQIPLDARLGSLNLAGKNLVDIARAMVKDGQFYLFDSVTRLMTARQYEAFVAVVQGLKARGKAVLLVPVSAEDIRIFGDRLYLLKGAQLNEIEGPRDLPDEELNGLFLHGDKKDVNRISDPIHRARAWIEQRVGDGSVDFKEIASSICMSYDNFRRKFKHQSGLSPNQYFIKLKIERAKETLVFSDLEIKEIAETLGFSDPYYFSRVFKEWEGVSPVRYRKEKSP
jgi:galactofuranose transport system ATP-binding protein